MQRGGIVVELARQAAASARNERAARLAALRPATARSYRGVHRRKNRYYAVIWNVHAARLLWLGSYETPEEAAYAYDAAARVTRGHRARPSFPVPAWWARRAAPAPEEAVSTDLVLALPTPAPARARRDPAAAAAAQASFDNWLQSSAAASPPAAAAQPQQQQQQSTPSAPLLPRQQRLLPPFTQFFYLSSDPAIAAANAAAASAAVVKPSIPGAYVLTSQNVQQVPSTNPASSALSSTDPVVHASQLFSAAAAPTQRHRKPPPPVSEAGVSDDLAVVGDNFPNVGASSSSAARPPVPRLTLMDLLLQLYLSGCGGSGGAQ